MKTSLVTRSNKKPRSLILVSKDNKEMLIQKLGSKWYVLLGGNQYLVSA